ncbi:XLF-domain-containing protein [Xylaria sp. FL0933]|nr:XLF-domain-containing protein [Xylaria sp. FL0933]
MESPSKWHPLPRFPALPALLASARFGESSYALYITDLANVWGEKLDRRGILLRSLQENTSIDLVDADAEQWAVFLSKLNAAFDPASPDHRRTSLAIAAAAESHSKNRDGLTLRITCELPQPLEALKWPVHLAKCQPASLASELVLPLIQEQYVRSREAKDLMNQLKEKDAIISKLLDKLSTMNTPLDNIFNSLSAKHAITRAAAEERIKGLAPFDEEKWRSHRKIERPQDALGLLQSVFGGPGFSQGTDMDLGVSDTLNDWWAKLGSGFHTASKPDINIPSQEPKEKASDSTASSEKEDVDEDFQVQVTPRRRGLRSSDSENSTKGKATRKSIDSNGSVVPDSHPTPSRNKPSFRIGGPSKTKTPAQEPIASQPSRTVNAEEDDTESETDDEKQPEPSKNPGQSKARLVTIGKPKQPSQTTKPAAAGDLSEGATDDTAPGSDSDSDSSSKPQRSSTKAPTTPRKRGLGRIGGKSKAAVKSPVTPTHDRASEEPASSSKKAEGRKLGTIGQTPRKEHKRLQPDTPVEPEVVETDEQKAERKRAELERELNRQSAAPARKKRKF